jgi:hypothetical protein
MLSFSPSFLFIFHSFSFTHFPEPKRFSHAAQWATPGNVSSKFLHNLIESDRNVTTSMCAGSSLAA